MELIIIKFKKIRQQKTNKLNYLDKNISDKSISSSNLNINHSNLSNLSLSSNDTEFAHEFIEYEDQ